MVRRGDCYNLGHSLRSSQHVEQIFSPAGQLKANRHQQMELLLMYRSEHKPPDGSLILGMQVERTMHVPESFIAIRATNCTLLTAEEISEIITEGKCSAQLVTLVEISIY